MKLLKSGMKVFCYHTSDLPPSLFIPLSPRLQSWKSGPWFLPTQHQSQDAAVGAAGLLTRACLLKSGIGQPLPDSNEIHVKGSGRGFFLLNTKPSRAKLFRGGQDIPPKLTVCLLASELDRSPTGAVLGSLRCGTRCSVCSWQLWGMLRRSRPPLWETQVPLFFSCSFHVQSLCSKPFFEHMQVIPLYWGCSQ